MKSVDWDAFEPVCLEMIDYVEQTGQCVDITCKGVSVLRLVPYETGTGMAGREAR